MTNRSTSESGFQSFDGTELKVYDGLFREILNEPKKDLVIDDIRAWVEERLPS